MAAVNVETFCAGTFSFFIGPEKTHFLLYRKLVSRYSQPFDRMISNGMKESQDGAAVLEHLDGETFGRFAEYIHSGDYSAASPVEMATASGERNILQVVQVEAYDKLDGVYGEFDQFVGYASKKKKKGKKVAPIPWSYDDEPETRARRHLGTQRLSQFIHFPVPIARYP